jgi:acetyl esterase/lipase
MKLRKAGDYMGFIARSIIRGIWKSIEKSDAKRIAGQTPTPGITGDYDIRYIDDNDPMHLLDVYFPEGTDELLPVIFDIHGGGWMYGDKELNKYYCLSLASRGFAVINISYRLLPYVKLEDQVSDIFNALHWLGAHGDKHHCDLRKVCLTGDSAGAHFASLIAAINADASLIELYKVKKLPFDIKAVAATHIAPDFQGDMFGSKAIDKELKRMLFGKTPVSNPIFNKSTIYDTAKPESYPPILIITSDADRLYPHAMKLIEYLGKNGFEYEAAIPESNPELGHVYNVTFPDSEEGKKMNDRIAAFFLKYS